MKARRLAATLLILAGAAVAIGRVVVPRHRCNVLAKRIERQTKLALDMVSPLRAASLTRRNLDELEQCRASVPWDVQFPMLMAGNHWIRGDREAARNAYREALEIDRRPEIYLNLGLVELELGDPNAEADLETACTFSPVLLYEVPEPLKSRIAAKIEALTRSGKPAG